MLDNSRTGDDSGITDEDDLDDRAVLMHRYGLTWNEAERVIDRRSKGGESKPGQRKRKSGVPLRRGWRIVWVSLGAYTQNKLT
jgi:hypothetical protein